MNENSLKNLIPRPFKKGQSGNPKGRPKKDVSVKRRIAKLLGIDPKELCDYNVDDMAAAVLLLLSRSKEELEQIKESAGVSNGDLSAVSIVERLRRSGNVEVWAEVYEMLTRKKLLDKKQEVELSTAQGSAFTIVLKDPKDEELFKDDENF